MADLAAIGDLNVGCMPGALFLRIRQNLDVSEQNYGWRAIVAVLNEDFNLVELAQLEREDSPTTKLIHCLASKNVTIRDFVNYAIRAENYFVMSLFNVYIPVEILQQPLEEMYVLEGENVNLAIQAKGHPSPQYQWYKNDVLIDGAIQKTFTLCAESQDDEGDYICFVYNNGSYKMSTPVKVRVLPAPELEVKVHPGNCAVSLGGNTLFRCEVLGPADISYQWHHNENPLQDVPGVVQGTQTNELRLYNVSAENWQGCYSCLASHGKRVISTNYAWLKVTWTEPRTTELTAVDKVALLIGNYDYRGDNVLQAPKNDVQILSGIFKSLHFKVVSLLNLTKSEMIAAVDEFKALVGKGVYCVFYFCGHGFEVARQSFLVPVDAPTLYSYEACVSAETIFRSLLLQEPQICCMILDICRKDREEQTRPGMLAQDVVERGNAIVCYGTSHGLSSYEGQVYGILVKHLKNVLALPVDIENVFKLLRDNMSNDPLVNDNNSRGGNPYKQIPEIRTNLLEVNRSFTDPVVYRGHTAVFNQRQQIWEDAHKKPDPIVLDFNCGTFTVKVKLDFQQEFSNVLKIYTSVLDPGPTEICIAFVSAIPADVAEKSMIRTISNSRGRTKLCKNYVTIHNIQRLKSEMKIQVTVKCTMPNVEKTQPVILGFPLVAKLQLWKPRELAGQRRAEEVDEGESIPNLLPT